MQLEAEDGDHAANRQIRYFIVNGLLYHTVASPRCTAYCAMAAVLTAFKYWSIY